MSKSVFCLCDTAGQAESIVDGLRAAGFSNNDISVLFPDKSGTRDFAHEQHTKAPEGAATGAGAGGAVGGVLGWLVGIGSLAIPGVGPFIAAGPIMAALAEPLSAWASRSMKQNDTREKSKRATFSSRSTRKTATKGSARKRFLKGPALTIFPLPKKKASLRKKNPNPWDFDTHRPAPQEGL